MINFPSPNVYPFVKGLLILLLFSSSSVHAAYPAPPSYPTEVYIKLSLNGLRKIDAVDSTFITDYYIMMAWRDDRLYDQIGSTLDPEVHFSPRVEIINTADGDSETECDNLIVDPSALPSWIKWTPSSSPGNVNETWVVAIGRKIGSFVADLELQEFPFDRQNASIQMESAAYQSSELVWRLPNTIFDGLDEINVGGWDNTGVNVQVINYTYGALEETYSRLIISKLLVRQYGYYLSRVFSNIIILVVMAFAVAFVRATEPDRLGFVQACFLGVVSWLFVLNAETPKVGYLTRLDTFTQTSFAAIFAQYLYHAVHWGYFKTYDRHLGRPTDDEKENEDNEKDKDDDRKNKCCEHCQEIRKASASSTTTATVDDKGDNQSIDTTEEELELHHRAQQEQEEEENKKESSTVEESKEERTNATPSNTVRRLNGTSTPSSARKLASSSNRDILASPVKSPSSSSDSANPIYVYIRNVKEAHGIPEITSPSKKSLSSSKLPDYSHLSYWERWKIFNPHRQLDVLVTAFIAVAYAIAVGFIVGDGISNANS